MQVIQDRWWGLGPLNERPAQMAVPLKTDLKFLFQKVAELRCAGRLAKPNGT